MPEYSQPKNDEPNSFIHTFNPAATTAANDKTFKELEGWQHEQDREKRWEEFWSEYEKAANC